MTQTTAVKTWGRIDYVTKEFRDNSAQTWEQILEHVQARAVRQAGGQGYEPVDPPTLTWRDAWTIRDSEGGIHYVTDPTFVGLNIEPDIFEVRTTIRVVVRGES